MKVSVLDAMALEDTHAEAHGTLGNVVAPTTRYSVSMKSSPRLRGFSRPKLDSVQTKDVRKN